MRPYRIGTSLEAGCGLALQRLDRVRAAFRGLLFGGVAGARNPRACLLAERSAFASRLGVGLLRCRPYLDP